MTEYKTRFKLCWDKDIRRFWTRVRKTEACWFWIGTKMANGYGYFAHRGKDNTAHRYSWLIANGKIPRGRFVCHRCDIRLCVNPDHLFIATHRQNVLDMVTKDRKFTKISIADARAIRALHLTGRFTGKQIGDLFEIGKDYANEIIRGDLRKEPKDVALALGIDAEAQRILGEKKA